MEECRALTELKQGTSRVVLTVNKGVAMVVMDKQDYTNKAHSLLADTNTYRILNKDPTSKLIQTIKDIKQSGGQTQVQETVSHKCCPPNFYGLPKIHNVGTPSGP